MVDDKDLEELEIELEDDEIEDDDEFEVEIEEEDGDGEDSDGEDGGGEDGDGEDGDEEDGNGEDGDGEDGDGEDGDGEDSDGEDSDGEDGDGEESDGEDGDGEEGDDEEGDGEEGDGEEGDGEEGDGEEGDGEEGDGEEGDGEEGDGEEGDGEEGDGEEGDGEEGDGEEGDGEEGNGEDGNGEDGNGEDGNGENTEKVNNADANNNANGNPDVEPSGGPPDAGATEDAAKAASDVAEATENAAEVIETAENVAEVTEATAETVTTVAEVGTEIGTQVATTAGEVSTGPPGWVIGIIEKVLLILKWIIQLWEKHPVLVIVLLLLAVGILTIPFSIPVIIIYAIISALWEFIASIFGFVEDTVLKMLDSITFGLVSYEKMDTMRDVNRYMGLLDESEEEYRRRAEVIESKKNEKAKLEKLKGYKDTKAELETKKRTETDEKEIEKLDAQIATYTTLAEKLEKEILDSIAGLNSLGNLDRRISDLEDEIEELETTYEQEAIDSKSQTRDMMFDMYDMTEDYFDELYVKRHYEDISGTKITLPTDLQDVNFDRDNKIIPNNTSRWINLSQTDKSKYLATTVYGVSEKMLDDLYTGKIHTMEGAIATKLEKGKTYYNTEDGRFKFEGSKTIYKNSLVSYYDILGDKLVDGIAFNGLKDYYGLLEQSAFKKENNGKTWNGLAENSAKQDEEIRKLLKTRLTSYVKAENRFWTVNGDKDVEFSDLGALGATLGVAAGVTAAVPVAAPVTVIAALGASASSIGDIIDKAIADNDNIKEEGYRVIQSKSFNATLAFSKDDINSQTEPWKLYPLACTNSFVSFDVELEGLFDWMLTEFGCDPDASRDELKNDIGDWFAKTFLQGNNIPIPSGEVLFRKTLFKFTFSLKDGADVSFGEKAIDGYIARCLSKSETFNINGNSITLGKDDYIVFDADGNTPVDYFLCNYEEIVTDKNGNTGIYRKYRYVKDGKLYQKFSSYDASGGYSQKDFEKFIGAKVGDEWEVKIGDKSIYVVDEFDANGNELTGFDLNNLFTTPTQHTTVADDVLEGKRGLWIGYSARVAFEENTMNSVQSKIYDIFKDGNNADDGKWYNKVGNWLGGDGFKSNQEVVDAMNRSYNVDLSDINSVNKAMEGTGFKLLDERELVKSYGIPSAFSYFVPLEESTRNIPFLIALAQEMKNTRIILSPLEDPENRMLQETTVYNISTEKNIESLADDHKNDWFGVWSDGDDGRLLIKLFGFNTINWYPKNLKRVQIQSTVTPLREVIYANLWDREIVNEFTKVVTPSNMNILGYEYANNLTKTVDYVRTNQYVVYKDKPYDLITQYNVSSADVGIYEEVTGRPFMNQYTYEKIREDNEEKAEKEWLDSLKVEDMYRPIDSTNIIPVTTGQDGVISAYKHIGEGGDVSAVKAGEVIEIEPLRVAGSQYTSYVILYHEEDQTYSMYSALDKINVSVGDKLNQGDVLGTYFDYIYFEYRKGGGDFKDFWSATSVQIGNDQLLDEVETKKDVNTPDYDAEAETGNESGGGGSGGAGVVPSMGGSPSNTVHVQLAP